MKDGTVKVLAVATVLAFMCMAFACIDANNSNGNNVNESSPICYATGDVWSGTSGGVDWYYYKDQNNISIEPSANPEDGYESGVMKDYSDDNHSPWDPDNISYVHRCSLDIAPGVKYIGAHAFESYRCDWSIIEGNVTLPDTVTEIGPYAFAYNDITSLMTSAKVIDGYAFYDCHCLGGELDLNYTDYIGNYAFANCNFEGVTGIGASYIGAGAFANCNKLTALAFLNEHISYIDGLAFAGCESVEEISFHCVKEIDFVYADAFGMTRFEDKNGTQILPSDAEGMDFVGTFDGTMVN